MLDKFLAAGCLGVLACAASAVEPKISIGDGHVLLLKTDGTVWAWGSNGSGQLGTGGSSTGTPTQIPGLAGVVDVVAKPGPFSMALKADGTVWVWGNVSDGRSGVSGLSGGQFKSTPFKVPAAQQMVSIASTFSGFTALAVDTLGQAWSWGKGTSGELGDGLAASRAELRAVAGLANVIKLATSNEQVLALRADGSVVGWGSNGTGSTSDNMLTGRKGAGIVGPSVLAVPPLVSIEAAQSNTAGQFFGIDAQGRPLIWGDTNSNLYTCHQLPGGSNAALPYTPTGLSGITQIAGGSLYSLLLTQSGQVLGCGYNGNGELGDGTTVSNGIANVPPKPGPATTGGLPASLLTLAAGTYSSAALDRLGGVYTWGRASGGLSGQGDGALPANNTSAVKLSVNAGASAGAPATFAGTQSGPITSATIDAGVAVAPAHAGQQGQIYLAVLLPNGALLLLDANGAFVPYDPAKPFTPLYQGVLPSRLPRNLVRDANLTGGAGAVIIMAYGLGSGAAADADMLTNKRFSSVLQLN